MQLRGSTTCSCMLLLLLSPVAAFLAVNRSAQKANMIARFVRLFSANKSTVRNPHLDNDDEEWHQVDSASTTPQFLSGLWQLIARGNSMIKGVSTAVNQSSHSAGFSSHVFSYSSVHRKLAQSCFPKWKINLPLVT